MEDLVFIATNKDGSQVEYQAIARYEDDKTNKNFIIYTDNTYDEFNKLKVYYSLYKVDGGKTELEEVTTNEDKQIALDIIKCLVKNN